MQHSKYIPAAAVIPYASLDGFHDVVRKLYLPPDVPKWQQLVRAAVLAVGIIEGWVSTCSPLLCATWGRDHSCFSAIGEKGRYTIRSQLPRLSHLKTGYLNGSIFNRSFASAAPKPKCVIPRPWPIQLKRRQKTGRYSGPVPVKLSSLSCLA